MKDLVREQWVQLRDRLVARALLGGREASLSMRVPGEAAMWLGTAQAKEPRLVTAPSSAAEDPIAALHAAVYSARGDVCAVAHGAGGWGLQLADFGGVMPGVFDEQVRHLGRMAAPTNALEELAPALAAGGNALIHGGQPVVLGTTAARLAMNAELFEKCAKAYVLATASGGVVATLPWIVRYVANGRLMKDQRRAQERVRAGQMPMEAKGY